MSSALSKDKNVGTLIVDEGGGAVATSIDPAISYDTIGAEPELNVYQTLIQYDNATTGVLPQNFIPVVATCVPGSTQCVSDYGSSLVKNFGTGPDADVGQYYTFVIDPAAHFYDPVSGKSWAVYPTDVMYSVARTISWASGATSGYTPGWILAQSLLPTGNFGWDGGLHAPYNTTPQSILGTMLINDTHYCPAKAMDGIHGDGCITFDANGGGIAWPGFLEFLEDPMGGGIMSCGWANSIAGTDGTPMPGFATNKNDSSCVLPDGLTSTMGSTWTSYVSGLDPTSWDAWDSLEFPAEFSGSYDPTPPIAFDAVGSGPYYLSGPPLGEMSLATGYTLTASPGYQQPSACSGAVKGIVSYASGGFCLPKVGKYIPKVDVTYYIDNPTYDEAALSNFQAGEVDFAPFLASDFATDVLPYTPSYISLDQFPSLSTFFVSYSLSYSATKCEGFIGGSCSEGGAAVPSDFANNIGIRDLLTASFPYATLFGPGYDKVGPVTFDFCAGGPIPAGMTPWYPTNVTYPCSVNGGVPDTSYSTPGSEAWWFAQMTDISSPYYNAELVWCGEQTGGCVFPLFGEAGNSILNSILPIWASDLYTISNHTLNPFPYDTESFGALVDAETSSSGGNNPAMVGNLGWAPDYPLPSDYENPMVNPIGIYTSPDYVSQMLDLTESLANATACGHTDPTSYANLIYWTNNPYAISTNCQGYAYDTAVYWDENAATLPAGALSQALLEYNLAGHIFNTLDLYNWQGNANEVYTFAPWINPASIDSNPTFGGGGDTIWYYVQYMNTQQVNFGESGLPADTTWGVSSSLGGVVTAANATVGYDQNGLPCPTCGQTVEVNLSAGKDVVVPSVMIQAPGQPEPWAFQSAAVALNPLVVTLSKTNAPMTVSLYFTETGSAAITAYGLAPTSTAVPFLCGSITSGFATKGPPTYTACVAPSGPTTIEVAAAPSGPGYYTYTMTAPTGFAICTKLTALCPIVGTLTKSSGKLGIVAAGLPTTGTIYFYPVIEKMKFTISGLPAYTTWTVTVATFAGPTLFASTLSNTTTSKGAGTIYFYIQQNASAVYGFSVNTYTLQTGYVPSYSSGYFTASGAKTIGLTAIDPRHVVIHLYGPEALNRLALEGL